MSEWIGIHNELPPRNKVVQCTAVNPDGGYFTTAGVLDDDLFFVFNEDSERWLECREVVSWRHLSDA